MAIESVGAPIFSDALFPGAIDDDDEQPIVLVMTCDRETDSPSPRDCLEGEDSRARFSRRQLFSHGYLALLQDSVTGSITTAARSRRGQVVQCAASSGLSAPQLAHQVRYRPLG